MLIPKDGILRGPLPTTIPTTAPPGIPTVPGYHGHAHFWERALSRRNFLATSAGVTGALASAGLWMPGIAEAASSRGAAPRPIPGGIEFNGKLFHLFLPAPDAEPSTIFDFKGFVGVAAVDGAGTATHTKTGEKRRLLFDVDTRFMQGTYIGLDGDRHQGTFGFI